MNSKRIILIIPEMSMGGAQRSLSKLSLELTKHHWVGLVIFNRDPEINYTFGGELFSLDVFAGRHFLSKARAFVQRIIRLRKLKKLLRPDVSISFLEGADYINVLSRVGDKVVLSIRGSKLHDETMKNKWEGLRLHFLMPWLYRKANAVVTVNHGIANELKTFFNLGDSKITTIGNYYDLAEIDKLAQEVKDDKLRRLYRDPVLVTSGRLAPEKGLLQLINVFLGLKEDFGNLRLLIIGDGPEHDPLINAARSANLNVQTQIGSDVLPDVLLIGNQKNVFKYLKGATLYLMNSSNEGFPNGLAEAMVCGIPVVSSDCPYGPREILAPEFRFVDSVTTPYVSANGVLMPLIRSEETLQVWIRTIKDLLTDKDGLSRFAECGRKRIEEFDQKSMMSRWHQVLDNVTGTQQS